MIFTNARRIFYFIILIDAILIIKALLHTDTLIQLVKPRIIYI